MSEFACNYKPELLPVISARANTHIKQRVRAERLVDQERILRIFAMERSLAHYDHSLADMTELSKYDRHQIKLTTYGNAPCVLKIYNLNIQSNWNGFIKEVARFAKLKHRLVAN